MQCTSYHNFLHKKISYLHALQGNREMVARYLDPKYSRWISVDPALGEYVPGAGKSGDGGNLPGMGGVFNSVNLSLFHYAGNNPVRYTDPTGMYAYQEFESIEDAAKDWAMTYADDSIFDKEELGSSIFSCERDGKTSYFYNIPYQGNTYVGEDGKPKRNTALNTSIDPGYEKKDAVISIVSGIHSHGDSNIQFNVETPSQGDKDGIAESKRLYGTHIGKEYLVTPGGFLFEFDVNGIIGEPLKADLPYSINIDFEKGTDREIRKMEDFTTLVGDYKYDLYWRYDQW